MTAVIRRRPMSPPPVGLIVAGGLVVLGLGTVAGLEHRSTTLYLTAIGVLALAAMAYLAVWLSPAAWVSLAVCGACLSGNSRLVHLPLSPDRFFVTAALAALVLRLPNVRTERTITWRPTHVFIALAAGYAAINAYQAGTLRT